MNEVCYFTSAIDCIFSVFIIVAIVLQLLFRIVCIYTRISIVVLIVVGCYSHSHSPPSVVVRHHQFTFQSCRCRERQMANGAANA